MKKPQRISTTCGWIAYVTSGTQTDGVILSMFRLCGGRKFLNAQVNGMKFDNADAAFDYAFEHGYLKLFGRNIMQFYGNRSFRRHTGRECMNPGDLIWKLYTGDGKQKGMDHQRSLRNQKEPNL